MTVRADTYALARPVPYLLQAGSSQTITAPIRHGADGSLVTPTETGSTVTITDPSDTALVSAAAVTVSSSTATYTLTPAATETLGSGWTVTWSLIISGVTYLFRESAVLCEYFPHNCVNVLDLYTEIPELRANIPQSQATGRGDGTGWQPQIDQAYYDFIRKLLDGGKPVWKLREKSVGAREWILARALQRCVLCIPRREEGTTWRREEINAYHRMKAADANLKLQYDDERSSVRRGLGPVIRLAPTGVLGSDGW